MMSDRELLGRVHRALCRLLVSAEHEDAEARALLAEIERRIMAMEYPSVSISDVGVVHDTRASLIR